uniref:G_PROTEIN_RECEP_F1_2 domain-containing protein n=1 Tax=Steinernema glaseri TaxID=37863 RepID=A0A1I7Z511_9BILA
MPFIVAITFATNSFIVAVLSSNNLRTPTNYILLAMAVTELLTGLSCLPWLLYYYTFKGTKTRDEKISHADHTAGYLRDEVEGLPSFWCTMFPYMATIMPSIFHTAAIWLTVYLAVQRYIYICIPKKVRVLCNFRRSKQAIVIIAACSVWLYAPDTFATVNESYEITKDNITRHTCVRVKTAFIRYVGSNFYYYLIYGLHTLLSHTLPCILLVVFTWKLIVAIRLADKRHIDLLTRSKRKKIPELELNTTDSSSDRAGTTRMAKPRGSTVYESKRSLKQNTRMLIVVILLFLVTEIPAALIFSVHVGAVAFQIHSILRYYHVMNVLLIIRNVLIVISYPFRFAIYCGMSQQFREAVQQMISRRRKNSSILSLRKETPTTSMRRYAMIMTERSANGAARRLTSPAINLGDHSQELLPFSQKRASTITYDNSDPICDENSTAMTELYTTPTNAS